MIIDLDIIGFLTSWLKNDNGKITYFLSLILISSLIDYLMGFINSLFNPKIKFSTHEAIRGIINKIVNFMVILLFVPVCLLVPVYEVGITALFIFLSGYLVSELNSILAHMGITNDVGKIELFSTYLKSIFSNNKENKGE